MTPGGYCSLPCKKVLHAGPREMAIWRFTAASPICRQMGQRFVRPALQPVPRLKEDDRLTGKKYPITSTGAILSISGASGDSSLSLSLSLSLSVRVCVRVGAVLWAWVCRCAGVLARRNIFADNKNGSRGGKAVFLPTVRVLCVINKMALDKAKMNVRVSQVSQNSFGIKLWCKSNLQLNNSS